MLERLGRYDHLLTGTRFVFRTNEMRTARVAVTYLSDTSSILADLDHTSRAFGFDETAIRASIEGQTVEYVFEVRPPSSVFSIWARGKKEIAIDQIVAEFVRPKPLAASNP